MKEIDFDELDRAVNSLINPDDKPTDAAAPQPVAAQPASSPAVTRTPSPVVTPAAAPAPARVFTPAPNPVPTPPPLAARRSSGRFMDVVHPSSDMRGATPPPQAAETPQQSVPAPISLPTPASVPDATRRPMPSAISVPDDASAPAGSITEPLETPFLTDAKVQKRPLGAFSRGIEAPRQMRPTSGPQPAIEMLDSSADQRPDPEDLPIESDTPMPAELQPDLMSVESIDDTNEPKMQPSRPAAPTQATSIAPQYQKLPSTGDQPAGNMYETPEYKKPQAAPGKRSGLFVIVWILLLLVVGAGVGAAVYFLVLPKL